MDATRFCYKAPCRFTVGGPLVDIHWYWADEDASVYLQPHAFPAMTGFRQFKFNDANVGEMWEKWPRHASVHGPAGVEGIAVDGTAAQFLGQAVFGPVVMADLPACLIPRVLPFEIDISVSDFYQQLPESTIVIGVEDPAEDVTLEIGADQSFMFLMEQTIVFDAAHHFESELIELGESTTPAAETACVDISSEDTADDPPIGDVSKQSGDIDLLAETTPHFPPAEMYEETILIGTDSTPSPEEPVIELSAADSNTPPDDQYAVVKIGAEDTQGGSGSGSGSGSDGGGVPGSDCDEALLMDNGVEYTVDVVSGDPDNWFKFWLPEGMIADIAYKTNSGGDRSMSWYHGECDDMELIRGTFEPLITFPFGPLSVDTFIIGYANNSFSGTGNYTVRISAS